MEPRMSSAVLTETLAKYIRDEGTPCQKNHQAKKQTTDFR